MDEINKVYKYLDTLNDLGINVLDSAVFHAYGWILDRYVEEITTEEGEEYLSRYLFERISLDESIFLPVGDDKVNVTNPEDFYDWMEKRSFWK